MTGNIATLIFMPNRQCILGLVPFMPLAAYFLTSPVLIGDFTLKNRSQVRHFCFWVRPFKGDRIVSESHDESAFALLGQAKLKGIQQFPICTVSQLTQDAQNSA